MNQKNSAKDPGENRKQYFEEPEANHGHGKKGLKS